MIRLAQEPLDIALPMDHPLAGRERLTPADVAGEPWVTSRAGYSPDDLLGAIAAVADRPVEVVHRINDYGSVASIVATGDAIGMVPRYTVGSALAGLVLRPLTGVNATRTIDMLTRPETLHRRSVQTTVHALRTAMGRLVRAGEAKALSPTHGAPGQPLPYSWLAGTSKVPHEVGPCS